MRDGFIKTAAATPSIRVADCAFNGRKITDLIREAAGLGVKVLVFPELCVTGYTCGDLFLQRTLLASAEATLERIMGETSGFDMLIALGLPAALEGKLYNTAALFCHGELLALVPKTHIPNYGEFYERRWFEPAPGEGRRVAFAGQETYFGTDAVLRCRSVPELGVGVEICEDLWAPEPNSGRLAACGATIILNLSASNELVGKSEYRRELVKNQSARLLTAYVYADAGEGESTTDLVFAGHDLICENGTVLNERRFVTGLTVSEVDVKRLTFERRRMTTFPPEERAFTIPFDLKVEETTLTRSLARNPFVPEGQEARDRRCQEIFTIQSQGLKKRAEHTGARRLVIGVSGGLDSTLALLVAHRTALSLGLPASAVLAVTMPCFGTTERTKSNATALSERLGAELRTVDITESVLLHFKSIGHDPKVQSVVFENAQARERTQVLMDIANAENGILVGTGDLSELALGWATYNGDHMSMYGVNGGVPKTLVRYVVGWYADTCGDDEVSALLNDILATPVSPELLPAKDGEISQRTEDIVGPYELHDFFLYHFLRWGAEPEKVLRLASIAFEGVYSREEILRWLKTFIKRFFAQQFKRSCLPDGPKVGSVALSPRGDWRMPSDASAVTWLERLGVRDV